MKPDNHQTNPFNNQESEETLVRESVVDTDQTIQSTLVHEPDEQTEPGQSKIKSEMAETASGKKNRSTWRKITIGGVTGIALGSAAAYGKEAIGDWSGEEVNPGPQNEEELQPSEPSNNDAQENVVSSDIAEPVQEPTTVEQPTSGFHVATTVHDNMTFGQAFAAARAEVGPGGIFEFEGEIYSTYYENEWDGMSQADKMEYNSRLNAFIRGELPSEQGAINTVETTSTDTSSQDSMTGDLQIQGVEVDSETGFTLIHAEMDGHTTVFVDNPQTTGIDSMGVDIDNSGDFTQNEIYNLSESGLTTDHLLQDTPYENFDSNDF